MPKAAGASCAVQSRPMSLVVRKWSMGRHPARCTSAGPESQPPAASARPGTSLLARDNAELAGEQPHCGPVVQLRGAHAASQDRQNDPESIHGGRSAVAITTVDRPPWMILGAP